MDNKKTPFIPYENYGLGSNTNLVLSFIKMYGNTYASNKHMSERLDVSTKTITRSIKKLEELEYIKIYNPLGRSRFIKLLKEPKPYVQDKKDKKSIYVGQNDHSDGQNVSLKLDNKSHNNKENNKIYNKVDNKGNNKPLDVLEDTITFSSPQPKKSLSVDRVKEILEDKESREYLDTLIKK